MEVQVHVPQSAGRRHPPGAQGGIARCSSKRGEDLLHLAARHVLDQDLLAGAPDRECRDPAAVAEHRDPIPHPRQLLEPVGDVDDAFPFGPEPIDHRKQALRLMRSERSRGFVEKQDGESGHGRLGELHQIPGRRGKITDQDRGRDGRGADALQRLPRAARHRAPAEEAGGGLLAPEEEILRDAHLRNEAQFLEDNADPDRPGVTRRPNRTLGAVQGNRAGIGGKRTGKDLDERRLAGSIFPHQDMHLAGADLEVDAVEGHDPREALGHPGDAEKRHHRLLVRIPADRCQRRAPATSISSPPA